MGPLWVRASSKHEKRGFRFLGCRKLTVDPPTHPSYPLIMHRIRHLRAHSLSPEVLAWSGGYFDWQNDRGGREWRSKIETVEADLTLPAPAHPITHGVRPFRLLDEYCFDIRFTEETAGWTPILAGEGRWRARGERPRVHRAVCRRGAEPRSATPARCRVAHGRP